MAKAKAKTEAKTVGRPSKYRPEFCEGIVAHMSQGLSFETYGAIIGVNQDTLHEWCKVHPEFSEAKKAGSLKSQLRYEQMGMAIMAGKIPGANVTAWIFNMKNRFHWRDQAPLETPPEQKEAESALNDALKQIASESKK